MTGFWRDDDGDWVAYLDCGHRQHVRHRPPFQDRAWVQTEEGRASRMGGLLECPLCERGEPATDPPAGAGGDPACWAHLVCADCGAVVGPGGGHREGCAAGTTGG
jgi:hypothetical protein